MSLKVPENEFDELVASEGIIPAPTKEWQHYIRQSYELVKAALPKKILKGLDGG